MTTKPLQDGEQQIQIVTEAKFLSKTCRRFFFIINISACLPIPLLILCASVTCWEYSNSHTCMEKQKQKLLSFLWLSEVSQECYWKANIGLYIVSTVQWEHFWLIITKYLEDQRKCGTLDNGQYVAIFFYVMKMKG